MLRNKKLFATVGLLSVLLLAPISALAEEKNGSIEIQLDSKVDENSGGGELTLGTVIDLSKKFDIDNGIGGEIPLVPTGKLEIIDTRASGQWQLSVKIAQPKERGTGAELAASGLTFGINVASETGIIDSKIPVDVLGTSAKVLSSTVNKSHTVASTAVTSNLTLSKSVKGVYQGTIVYTLIPETATYTVSFDSNGGTEVTELTNIAKDSKVAEPTSPTRSGYTFDGWTKTKDGNDYWAFDNDIVSTNTTLYAKWTELPSSPPVAGDGYRFADTDWRILKVEDDKALIIKIDALTAAEAGIDMDVSTPYADVPFLSDTAVSKSGLDGLDAGERNDYYFDSDGSNGYEDSGGASYESDSDPKYKYGLKGAIDYYYNHTLKDKFDSKILAVDLNNPTLSEHIDKTDTGEGAYSGSSSDAFDNGYWTSYYRDKRFSTSLSAVGNDFKKQAFALSYGDINKTMGAVYTVGPSYLDVILGYGSESFPEPNYFWLRSAGAHFFYAGSVLNGNFGGYERVYDNQPVRPALWIKLD
ncbi:MAG: InlB B-repeat-containing protein [Streptococcaceae bacterium]|jgi:uncharacterized repeat protein (TIGR02543 family)|nr:InlB B-repeat-containing protein [Streptococcaceae bacterium]